MAGKIARAKILVRWFNIPRAGLPAYHDRHDGRGGCAVAGGEKTMPPAVMRPGGGSRPVHEGEQRPTTSRNAKVIKMDCPHGQETVRPRRGRFARAAIQISRRKST